MHSPRRLGTPLDQCGRFYKTWPPKTPNVRQRRQRFQGPHGDTPKQF